MKSKPIDFEQDAHSLNAGIALMNLLVCFGIPSAEEMKADLEYTLEEDCCHECDSRKDDCECEYERNGRYMPEYDDGADFED